MRKTVLFLTLLLACLLAACGQQPAADIAPALPAAADPALDDLDQARMMLDHYVLNHGDSRLAENNGLKAVNAWLGNEEDELNSSQLAQAALPDHWDPEQPPLVAALAWQIQELGLYRAAAALSLETADSGPLPAFGSFAQENPELLFPGPSGPLAILGWLADQDPAPGGLKELNEEQAGLYAGLAEIYQQRRANPAVFAQEAGALLTAEASPQLARALRQRLALQIRADLRDAYEKRLTDLAETLAGPVLLEIREAAVPGRPPTYASHGVWLLKDGAGATGLPAFVLDAQGACVMAFTVRQYLLAGAPETAGVYAPGQSPATGEALRLLALTLTLGENRLEFGSGAPALADLFGAYSGQLTLDEFYLAPDLGLELTDQELALMGCDAALQNTVGDYLNKPYPIAVTLKAGADGEGLAVLTSPNGSRYELPFTYQEGELIFTDLDLQGLSAGGVWTVQWLPQGGLGFSGQLSVEWPAHPGEFYSHLSITGEPEE